MFVFFGPSSQIAGLGSQHRTGTEQVVGSSSEVRIKSEGKERNKGKNSLMCSFSGPASRSNSISNETAPSIAADTDKYDVRGWLKKAGPKVCWGCSLSALKSCDSLFVLSHLVRQGTGWKRRWFILNGNLLV